MYPTPEPTRIEPLPTSYERRYSRPCSRHRARPTLREIFIQAGLLFALFSGAAPTLGSSTPGALTQSPSTQPQAQSEEPLGAVIRILPLVPTSEDTGQKKSTRRSTKTDSPEKQGSSTVVLETLTIHPEIAVVRFFLDGEPAGRAVRPPFSLKVTLTKGQPIEVLAVAEDQDGKRLGSDTLQVNRTQRPFRIDLQPITSGREIDADLSLPAGAELSEVEFFLGDEPLGAAQREQPFRTKVPAETKPTDFVRVVAKLKDGREVEDVELLSGQRFQDRVDVQLVQLQVVVTDKQGRPLEGLTEDNFTLGKGETVDRVLPAEDVRLVLGLALDTSGSMRPIWNETKQAAELFLNKTLTPKDRGFLVDFNSTLRLPQPTTDNHELLKEQLEELAPEGGTALYDAILFSLIQFDREAGRRGLVVLTDGYDVESRSNAERAIELGKRMGVPIYIVVLPSSNGRGAGAPTGRAGPGGQGSTGGGFATPQSQIQELYLFTDPSGGRLFRLNSPNRVGDAFQQISQELRNQYTVTYYTANPPKPGNPPKVTVKVDGKKGIRVRTVFGTENVY